MRAKSVHASAERIVQAEYAGFPNPLLCTHNSAKLPREAR